MKCEQCKWYHRLKHNFKQHIGYEESHACDVMLHMVGGGDMILEVTPEDKCEMFTEAKNEV